MPGLDTSGTRASDAPALMPTYYLDVAAVRIQTWLGRTPKLTQRRGASYLLEEVTGPESTARMVDQIRQEHPLILNLEVNQDAGDISGVINLAFTAPDEATARRQALQVATGVAQRVREQVPAVPVQAWVATGATYLQAWAAAHAQAAAAHAPLLDLPVVHTDLPVVRACALCAVAAATTTISTGDEQTPVCPDCRQRAEHAGSSRAARRLVPKSSQRLLQDLTELQPTVTATGFPYDFNELAECGRRSRDDALTQLATVFADGNRIGQLLARLADKDTPPQGTDQVVALLNRVTRLSVAYAVGDLLRGASRPDWSVTAPIILHLAGGDDVLATVPAPLGWTFATSLSRRFDQLTQDKTLLRLEGATKPRSLARILGEAPSISSAIVFHHRSAPFADVVQRAEQLLHQVKISNEGAAAAVGFLDLTDDGGALVGEAAARPGSAGTDPAYADRCLPLDTLPAAVFDALAQVHPSQRQTLRDLLRQHPTGPDAVPAWRDTIAHRVQVMNLDAVTGSIRGAVPAGSAPQKVIGANDQHGDQARRRLRRDLDVARWWLSPEQLADLKEVR